MSAAILKVKRLVRKMAGFTWKPVPRDQCPDVKAICRSVSVGIHVRTSRTILAPLGMILSLLSSRTFLSTIQKVDSRRTMRELRSFVGK